MCGIVAIYYKNNKPLSDTVITTCMLNAMSHRGNDQVLVQHYPSCTVGFRRLAITELGEQQPKGDNWIVYLNGEIYNYKELGYEGSECSVLSQGFEEHGTDFVKKLNGMFFILAIRGNDVFVFRDRYGIKPIYYYETENIIIVASEIKAIIQHPEYKFKINESAKRQWFVFNNVLTDETLFDGVYKVPKGTMCNLNSGKKKKYWTWEFKPDDKMDFEFAKSQIKHLVKQAVFRQTPQEVKFASCLSGGVDSNIIAHFLDENVPTFTAGFEGWPDERLLANLSKRLSYNEIVFKNIYDLNKTIFHLEDLRVGASWSNYGLYKFISETGHKVCFDGAGADELFGGYNWRYTSKDYYSVVNRTGINDIYCEELFKFIYPNDTLENRFKFDANYFLEAVLLVVDKLSMAHTIEMRLPFLDNDLVDFCLTLPNEFKKNKLILKAAFEDVIHPDIINGPKRGFSSPDWFEGEGNQALKWANAAYSEWEKQFKK